MVKQILLGLALLSLIPVAFAEETVIESDVGFLLASPEDGFDTATILGYEVLSEDITTSITHGSYARMVGHAVSGEPVFIIYNLDDGTFNVKIWTGDTVIRVVTQGTVYEFT